MVSEPLTPESSELNNEDLFTIELSQLRKRNFALKIAYINGLWAGNTYTKTFDGEISWFFDCETSPEREVFRLCVLIFMFVETEKRLLPASVLNLLRLRTEMVWDWFQINEIPVVFPGRFTCAKDPSSNTSSRLLRPIFRSEVLLQDIYLLIWVI
jgi:hypothetical protein